MRWTARAVVLLTAFCVFAAPAAADVIPSRIETEEDKAAQAKVEHRFAQLGYAPETARLRAQELSLDEAAFFARAPGALRFVGQQGPDEGQDIFSGQSYNLWYESVFGVIALGVTVLAIGWAVKD